MSMLKRFNEEEHINKAVQQTYENIYFPHGFANFLEALSVEKIVKSETTKRTSLMNGYRWINEVQQGGIKLETTGYPYTLKEIRDYQFAGNLIVTGSKDDLEIVHSILERHGAKFNGATAPEHVELNIQYHDTLNPKLWDDQDGEYSLHADVYESLADISQAFYEFLDIPDLDVDDVTITGSSANFNWTENSDMDIHLVVDMKKSEKKFGKLAIQYFDAIKKVWNELHDIKIKGIPVEIYVQDKAENHNSTGVYSIKDEDWVIEPKHEEPTVDDMAVKAKASEWMTTIREITSACNKADTIEKVMEKLSKLRQAGLDKGGEFSTENLAFKVLRNHGYLDLLANCKTKAFDRELSVQDEEWSRLK